MPEYLCLKWLQSLVYCVDLYIAGWTGLILSWHPVHYVGDRRYYYASREVRICCRRHLQIVIAGKRVLDRQAQLGSDFVLTDKT